MKKRFVLLGLLVLALFLAGCSSELTVLLKLPINIEATYHKEIDGYLYYDLPEDRIIISSSPISGRFIEPLNGARITVLETGRVTYADRYGYFVIKGIPSSYNNINLDIKHDDLRKPSRSRRYSVHL